ncbi:MAG: Nif11-like leader peptide family natural product precursor [Gemmatimonadetes bacterium]|nr:Nif11-like leader peptide family natural product precursor [Gemmatimonadota bacterium]
MSGLSELERFSRDVAGNAALRQEILTSGTDLATVVAYANGKGYGFSVQDVRERAVASELSEEALGAVAGGGLPVAFDVASRADNFLGGSFLLSITRTFTTSPP